MDYLLTVLKIIIEKNTKGLFFKSVKRTLIAVFAVKYRNVHVYDPKGQKKSFLTSLQSLISKTRKFGPASLHPGAFERRIQV